MMAERTSPHRVAILALDGVFPFELGIPLRVLGAADGHYDVRVCSVDGAPVPTNAGFAITPEHGPEILATADTVIIAPTHPSRLGPELSPAVAAALAQVRPGTRIASICTGAFVLAAAGILDGHRATTHWGECAELARRYPEVTVDPDVLYVDEGDLLTSAGSAASIDLCLHVVQRDYGRAVATRLARELVVPLYRDGGQAQFIDTPIPVLDDRHLFADTLTWLQSHLDQSVSVRDLAERAAMSPRTFARRFLSSTGLTPYQWIVRERIRLAQRLLETSDLPVDAIAVKTGFATAGNLRKHFSRTVRTSPHAYRDSFRRSATSR